jgi:succinate dehydrogenase hydrophobic anchor subunit
MEKTKTKSLPLTRRGLNFEMLMWIFTRVSALAMYALVLFAIIGALIMGARYQMNLADLMRWGFTPNVTHVQNTNVPDVAPWVTPFWKVTACLLVLIAVAHGVHGLVVIADDYIVSPRGRQVVRIISILLVLLMSVIGVYVIWTS